MFSLLGPYGLKNYTKLLIHGLSCILLSSSNLSLTMLPSAACGDKGFRRGPETFSVQCSHLVVKET